MAILSLHKEPKRRFTHTEKRKKKMLVYDFDNAESDTIESDFGPIKKEPRRKRPKSAEKAVKSSNHELRRSPA